jgi:hypothetical protein
MRLSTYFKVDSSKRRKISLNSYEVYIVCKNCREGKHSDCSKNKGPKDEDNIVRIKCTCDYCGNNCGDLLL